MIEKLNKICPLYTNGTSKRELRHDFFKEIETEIQAYLLGFITADGSVNKKRHTLMVNIHPQDREIIELLKIISPKAYTGDIKGYESITTVRGRTVKNSGSVRIAISSKILIEDLEKYGVVQNKTYSEINLPDIREDLIPHYIRGYFDGDGSISYRLREPNKKNREVNPRIVVSFTICGKTQQIFKDIQKWALSKEIKLNINYLKRDDMYRISTASRKTVTQLYNELYKNSKFYLSRKFNIIDYYVNTEVSQMITDHRNAQEMSANDSKNSPTSEGRLEQSKICAEPIDE